MAVYRPSHGEELYHYGVLGMKWGIRKDKDKVLRRSMSKLAELDLDRMKTKDRLDNSTRAWRKERKNDQRKRSKVNLRYSKRVDKLSEKQLYKKAEKGLEWIKTMQKEFGKVGVTLDPKVDTYAKSFLKSMRDADVEMRKIDKDYAELGIPYSDYKKKRK